MQRAVPPGFDSSDDARLAQQVRYAIEALAWIGGGAHGMTSYIADQTSTLRIVSRTFDASFAKDVP